MTPPDPATFETALAQTRRLGRLVEQLLDLSRLESGTVPLDRRRTALAPLLEQAVREAEVTGRDVRLSYDVTPADLTAHADEERLHQVLANLLDNATRHSPAGGAVRVTAEAVPHGILLVVEDHGPGIEPADQERVFERFARADTARSGGGSGLGLAITRWVVDLHGGSVHAETTVPPPGCRVVVELPDSPETAR